MDDSLQPTVDMLLNLAIFMWFGAVCPWASFADNDIIPIYRLVALGILILLFRRLPVVLAMHKYIHQIEQFSQAAFVGFFGPIGVGAIFYLSVCRQFLLEEMMVDGEVRDDAKKTADAAYLVVWFLVICSIVSFSPSSSFSSCHILCTNRPFQVVHGLSVPLGKAGYHIPRTISSALSDSEPIRIPSRNNTHSTATTPALPGLRYNRNRNRNRGRDQQQERDMPARPVFRIGGGNVISGDASSVSLQESAAATGKQQQQQQEEQGREQVVRDEGEAASVQASSAVHEPRRPVRLLGEDGRVTETLNASE